MSKSLLLNQLKVKYTIDDIRLNSNLTIKKTIRFSEKAFFYTKLQFTESYSGILRDIPGFVQLIPGSYKCDEPIKIRGIDKIQLKCDCINGSIVNGISLPILYSFALSSPPGLKIYKDPRIKFSNQIKQINKPVLSHIMFYLEDADYKPVDFSGETISFTCQLIKKTK